MKSLLLDTHAWVWSFGADHLLSERAPAAITTADVVYLSPISFLRIPRHLDSDSSGNWTAIPRQTGQFNRVASGV